MLQEGVPRRVLCWRLEGLELLLLFSRASVPRLPSIYCVPLPRPLPPRLPGDQKALPVLVSSVVQNLVGSVRQQACPAPSGAPGSDAPSVLSLQRAARRANKKPPALLLDRGSCRLSPLSPSSPRTCHPLPFCPGETGASLARGWAPSGRAVRETAGRMQGWAPRVGWLWNGSFWLALVLASVHADVVRACISYKESLFVEKEI
ncbi:unnamed protein product [Gulo gulo]|uniref:Uncharacterized protein n=1 Tax=Gulo gulo TaxID=48420 RepID=A0A9X9LFZ2_GULGU|nr:unnamed protein product [Gulo gulo]